MLRMLINKAVTIAAIELTVNIWPISPTERSKVSPISEATAGKSRSGLAKQEFALAAGNPKAILIFTAFLPQFVDVSDNAGFQFFILGITFLMLELLAISIYALFGLYMRHWFAKPAMAQLFNRGCASFLALSGVNLMVSRN